MKVTATLSRYRISPRKARLVAQQVKGLPVQAADQTLTVLQKKAAQQMRKLLESAVANAEHNFGLDKTNLYVYDIQVGDGLTMKRWMPRAHGRATPILKRTSNITLILEEKEHGKRKTPEELQKEREEKRKKQAEEFSQKAKDESEKSEEGTKKSSTKPTDIPNKKEKKAGANSGWQKKMFRRKSS
jgi:large subunit ribosomal protein L22